MDDPDGRSFDGKLKRAEAAEASTGSPLTGAAPGTYVDPATGKATRYQGSSGQNGFVGAVESALLGSLNAPGTVNDQGQPLPITDAANGYAPSGGPGSFTVSPEDLKTFASRMQSVHDDYFLPGKPVDVSTVMTDTQNVQLGPLAESTALAATYTSFREQLVAVLGQLQTLVQSLAVQGDTSSVTYQEIEDRIAQTMRALGGGLT